MDKRTILAFLLIFVVIALWNFYLVKTKPRDIPPRELPKSAQSPPPTSAPTVSTARIEAPVQGRQSPSAPVKDVIVETSLYRAVFTSAGGNLKSLRLKGYSGRGKSSQVELIPAGRTALAISADPGGNTDHLSIIPLQVEPETLMLSSRNVQGTLEFTGTAAGGRVRKTYTFDEGTYSFDLDVSVEDSLGRRLPHWIAWGAGLEGTEDDVKEDQSYFSAPYYSNKRKEEKKLGDLQKAKRDSLPGMFDWAGVRTKYFVAAMIPRDSRGTMVHWAVEAGTSRIETSLKNPDGHQYRIYAGPVEYRSLKGVGVGMETLCDYGWTWIRPVSRVMLEILLFLHRYLKNYGLVIIVFSILMRVVFFPLTFQSLKSMQAMQRLSPKMNKLREQFKDDPARLNREMMSLYRKQRVNPLGGCLPMIIQIPIFFALYSLLRATIEMRRAPFMLWIQDLSLMDPYYVLPVVMGASMFLQQKLMTQDPRQKMMMYMMPVLMTFLFLRFAAGLNLYFLVTNLLSIAENIIVRRRTAGGVATETA